MWSHKATVTPHLSENQRDWSRIPLNHCPQQSLHHGTINTIFPFFFYRGNTSRSSNFVPRLVYTHLKHRLFKKCLYFTAAPRTLVPQYKAYAGYTQHTHTRARVHAISARFAFTCCLGRQSTAKKDNFCRSLKREDCPLPSSPEMASTPFDPAPPPPPSLSAPSERPRPLAVTPVTSSFALTARHSCGSDSSVGAARHTSPESCRGSEAERASCLIRGGAYSFKKRYTRVDYGTHGTTQRDAPKDRERVRERVRERGRESSGSRINRDDSKGN